jgi:DNA-binding CsgD family transcriptional regulator
VTEGVASDPIRARDLWEGLLAGRYVIVQVMEHADRRYLLMRPPGPEQTSRAGLTEREREVASHAASGASIKAIALDLGLASSTVCAHLSHALRKLGLRDRAELLSLHPDAHTSSLGATTPRSAEQVTMDGSRSASLERSGIRQRVSSDLVRGPKFAGA